jgi:hypothetical protein
MPEPLDRTHYDRQDLLRALGKYLASTVSSHTQAGLIAQLLRERHGLDFKLTEIPKRELLELSIRVAAALHQAPHPSEDGEASR